MEGVLAARLLIACLALTAGSLPANAAFVNLNPSYDDPFRGTDVLMIPGAADFRALSRPMSIIVALDESGEAAAETFATANSGTTWPPNNFQRVNDPVILPELPESAGWIPLVGGLALVAYRMRRTDRRVRFRSAV